MIISKIKRVPAENDTLRTVTSLVKDGWPTKRKAVPGLAQLYIKFCNELTLQNGLVLKSDRVVIQMSLRKLMLQELHSSHLGMEGTIRRAKKAVYWPGMPSTI